MLLWSLTCSYFSQTGKPEKPLCSPQFCKCFKVAQTTAGSCCSLTCSCASICAGTQEFGWRLVVVLMNSEKLPLYFGWCHVLDSVLSSTVQALVPAQKQREVQVALFSDGLSLTGLRYLCLSPCSSEVYANRPFPEYKRVWELRTNSPFAPFP